MNETEKTELEKIAFAARKTIIKMSGNGGCFIGASLSCADITTYLYNRFLNVKKENLSSSDRDYFFLSKGHDVPALYAVLAEAGFIPKERLQNHLKTNDFIYWHPNRNIPGIEFHSGSLGHLLSVAIGVAYDCKLKNGKNKVVVILGDGELNEGSVWESILIAAAYKLNNLIVVVDRNRFQANMRTEELIPLDPLENKFKAFGCEVTTCNGHDFIQLDAAFNNFSEYENRPYVIIAETVRGKGLPSIEERADRWFCNFKQEEITALLNELETKQKAELTSEILMVR